MAGRLITPGIQGQCGEGRCYEQQAHAFGVARNKWKSEIPHRVADQHRWLQADDLGEEKGSPVGHDPQPQCTGAGKGGDEIFRQVRAAGLHGLNPLIQKPIHGRHREAAENGAQPLCREHPSEDEEKRCEEEGGSRWKADVASDAI